MDAPEIQVTRRGLEEKWQSQDGKTGLSAHYETRGVHLGPPEERASFIVFTLSGEVRSGHARHDSELHAEIGGKQADILAVAIDAVSEAAFPNGRSLYDLVTFSSQIECPGDGVLYFGFRVLPGRRLDSAEAFLGIRNPSGELEITFSDSSDLSGVRRFIRRALVG